MKKYLIAITGAAFLVATFAVAPSAQARTDDNTVKNNCANLKTGKLRPTRNVSCLSTEISIGFGPIKAGSSRPTAFNPLFENRIKLAKSIGQLEGYQLNITSGWRTLAYQQMLFDRAVISNGSVEEASKWVLPPQYSMHPWGIAVDINYKYGRPEGAAWLEANGYKFGLCRRYKNEWWHFEPLVAPGTICPLPEDYPVAK